MLHTSQPSCAVSSDPDGATEERRDSRRYVLSWGSFCRLQPWPESRAERVLLHDISARGIGLVLTEPPPVGTVLALQLPACGSGAGRWTAAEVRQVTQLAKCIWVVGCALCEALSEEDVQDVLSTADDSP
jgi:hypothetical protein